MNALPKHRGLALLAAQRAALDAGELTARERLDDALGEELARKLLFALTGDGESRQRSGGPLDARPGFAA
jgi:hypothetical protein